MTKGSVKALVKRLRISFEIWIAQLWSMMHQFMIEVALEIYLEVIDSMWPEASIPDWRMRMAQQVLRAGGNF